MVKTFKNKKELIAYAGRLTEEQQEELSHKLCVEVNGEHLFVDTFCLLCEESLTNKDTINIVYQKLKSREN